MGTDHKEGDFCHVFVNYITHIETTGIIIINIIKLLKLIKIHNPHP